MQKTLNQVWPNLYMNAKLIILLRKTFFKSSLGFQNMTMVFIISSVDHWTVVTFIEKAF